MWELLEDYRDRQGSSGTVQNLITRLPSDREPVSFHYTALISGSIPHGLVESLLGFFWAQNGMFSERTSIPLGPRVKFPSEDGRSRDSLSAAATPKEQAWIR